APAAGYEVVLDSRQQRCVTEELEPGTHMRGVVTVADAAPGVDISLFLSDPAGKIIIHKRSVSEHAFAFHTPARVAHRGGPPSLPHLPYKLCLRASRVPLTLPGRRAAGPTARRVRVRLFPAVPPPPPPGLLVNDHTRAVAATVAEVSVSVQRLVQGVADLRARAEAVERQNEAVASWVVGG
ncbi:hypothetical protein BU14_3174s0001, partial [Porphyra umbilicalis]